MLTVQTPCPDSFVHLIVRSQSCDSLHLAPSSQLWVFLNNAQMVSASSLAHVLWSSPSTMRVHLRVHHEVHDLQLLEVLNLMVEVTVAHCGAASDGPEVSTDRDTVQPRDKGHLNDLVHLPEPPALWEEPDQTLLFRF